MSMRFLLDLYMSHLISKDRRLWLVRVRSDVMMD